MCFCTKENEKRVEKYSLELSPDKDYAFILEQHLHAQFAENSNAHVSSFVTFVVSLLALFGAFAYGRNCPLGRRISWGIMYLPWTAFSG